MASGILNFQQYIGGPDQVKVEQIFPSNQKTLVYDFDRSVSGWTFSADYQTLVVDTIAFNRSTGQPNFSNSTVIGSFAKVDLTGGDAPAVQDAATGIVHVYFPANMYTGPIVPDARVNVPITVFAVTWTDAESPANINTHRWALIQCWEPDVTVGDPKSDAGYTALTLAS